MSVWVLWRQDEVGRMDETCIRVAGQWKYLYRMHGFKSFRSARALIAGIETAPRRRFL